jgi:DNA-binding CsgD family transcriptional regulator
MVNVMIERRTAITERQQQIVALIAQGCTNAQVGVLLGISPRTAKAHCDVLRAKLGVSRRRYIPGAFRALTGKDPLSQGLSPDSRLGN